MTIYSRSRFWDTWVSSTGRLPQCRIPIPAGVRVDQDRQASVTPSLYNRVQTSDATQLGPVVQVAGTSRGEGFVLCTYYLILYLSLPQCCNIPHTCVRNSRACCWVVRVAFHLYRVTAAPKRTVGVLTARSVEPSGPLRYFRHPTSPLPAPPFL